VVGVKCGGTHYVIFNVASLCLLGTGSRLYLAGGSNPPTSVVSYILQKEKAMNDRSSMPSAYSDLTPTEKCEPSKWLAVLTDFLVFGVGAAYLALVVGSMFAGNNHTN